MKARNAFKRRSVRILFLAANLGFFWAVHASAQATNQTSTSDGVNAPWESHTPEQRKQQFSDELEKAAQKIRDKKNNIALERKRSEALRAKKLAKMLPIYKRDKELLKQRLQKYECLLIRDNRDTRMTQRRHPKVLPLIDAVKKAFATGAEPFCLRVSWSGVDSGGNKYILIEHGKANYFADTPSIYDGGPRIYEYVLDALALGQVASVEGSVVFTEVSPSVDVEEPASWYVIQLYVSDEVDQICTLRSLWAGWL